MKLQSTWTLGEEENVLEDITQNFWSWNYLDHYQEETNQYVHIFQIFGSISNAISHIC